MNTTEHSGAARERVRVLFVGTSAEDLELVRALLSQSAAMHFDVTHGLRLVEALALPEESRPDVLLLRVDGSDLSGVASLTRARLSAPTLPVVVLSDASDEASALRSLQSGARGFVVKSEMNTRSLVTALAAAHESHRMIHELNSARDRAQHLATHDPLTGLANRALFRDRLAQELTATRRSRQHLAVLSIDLDGFRNVNESLGHAVGDGLLRSVSRRISAAVGEKDAAARLGSDQFAVLLTYLDDEIDAATVARKLIAELSEPLPFRSQVTAIRCSIGIATFPRDTGDPEELIKKADTAMCHAKQSGGGRFEFYTEEMNASTQKRVALEKRLRTALDDHGFLLHYQPQFDLARGRIIGAEALLRWQHPDLGLITPSQFLPIAEETGQIVPIGEWILRTACEQNACWIRAGHRGHRMSVNVSSQQFLDPGFAEMVRRALDASGVLPQSLELELTESSLLRDVNVALDTLHALKELGVRLAIDDFGTGYSALAYLKRLPIDVLKIDQSFIRSLTTDPADATITEMIVKLAAGLNLTTIAEGVETFEQLLLLGSFGCKRMQGFLFGRPVPAETFTHWLDHPPFRWTQTDAENSAQIPEAGAPSTDA